MTLNAFTNHTQSVYQPIAGADIFFLRKTMKSPSSGTGGCAFFRRPLPCAIYHAECVVRFYPLTAVDERARLTT